MTALPPGRQPTRRDYSQRSTLLNMKYNASIHKTPPKNRLISVQLLEMLNPEDEVDTGHIVVFKPSGEELILPGLKKPLKIGSVQMWPPPFVVGVPEPLQPAVREIGFVFKAIGKVWDLINKPAAFN